MLGYPLHRLKKNIPTLTSSNGGESSSQPLNSGLPLSLSSPQVDYAPITDPQLRQQQHDQDIALRNQSAQQQKTLSDRLSKIRSELPKETQDSFDNILKAASARPADELRGATKEEIDHDNFMKTPVGKVLGGVAYLGSKATKGTLQIAKGVAHYGNLALNANNTAAKISTDLVMDEADKKANFGLTRGDQARMDDNSLLSNVGGITEFAPAIAGAASTGGATFFLQGAGQAVEQLDKAEKESGVKVNPLVREAYIGGTGLANKFLMHDIGGIFSKLPAGIRGDVAAEISANAIKELSGKELTGDTFNEALQTGAKEWNDKVSKFGLGFVEKTAHAATNLSALRGSSFLMHNGVDATTDKPVFHDTPADLAQDISNIVVKQAPMFGALGSVGELSKLTPYSNYKNSVVESLMHDPSEENVQKVKQDLVDFNKNQDPSRQWNRDEVDATVSQVDKIADVAKKLPRGIPAKKMVDAVDLVNGREDLKTELAKLQEERGKMDESVNQEPSAGEQLLIDKIDQANDKLKDIVSGKRTTYSIEKGEDGKEDKFFKKVDGKTEKITESRYNLENLERKSKTNEQPIESAPVESAIPETPQANETGVPETVGEKPVETTQNNINNESNEENGGQSIAEGSENQGTETGSNESSQEANGLRQEEVARNRVKDSDAPTLPDLSHNLKEKGESGISIEEPTKRQYGTNELTDEPLDNGNKYVVSRDKDGKVNGVLEVSYNSREGVQDKPSSVKVVVDENSRRQGIATALFKHAEENGIDLKDVRGKETTDAGQALFESNKKNNEQTNTSTTEPIAGEIKQPEIAAPTVEPEKTTTPKENEGVTSPVEPIGITKEETRKQREIRGLENIPDADRTTMQKMFDSGKEAVQTGQIDPQKLAIDVSDKPRNLSSVEVNALLYDRQAIREQSDAIRGQIEDLLVKQKDNKNFDNILDGTSESMQVLQDRQRFLDAALDNNEKALRAGANQNALALVAMQNMINADYTLSEQRARMRVKAGGELTEAMEAELKRYDEELKAAKAEVEAYKQRLNEKLAKEAIKKAQAEARVNKKTASREAILTERKAIVEDFKAAWDKALVESRKNLSSDVPYRRELTAATIYMTRMVANLAKEGIVEFKDVVEKIHDEFKEYIENLTKEDVRDVLAGVYRERKETKNDLLEQKNAIIRIASLTKQIDDLKNGVKTEKKEAKLVKKRQAILDLEKEVKTLKSQARIEDAADLSKESLKRRIEKLNERIKNQDFEKSEGRPKVEADAESITLTARLRRAQNNYDAMADRLSSHTESGLDKTLTTIQQVRRLMLLSGVKTLGKLYAFAADRTVTTPIEEIANTLNSKLPFLRKIAQRSPRFSGGISAKAEAQAIVTRISKATLKDSWIDVLKTGVGEIDRVYFKHGVDKDFDLNPHWLEFFGRLHGALKNSTKRAEFFRSYQKRLQHYAEQGKDINDPNIQFATGLEAYADGKRAILMNDNILVDKGYKSLLRGLESGDNNQAGKVFAAVIRGLFPLVKIPTNYVVESFDVATLGARAIPKIIQAMTKGADSLTPKEADMVMRTIAKGQIGLALMMYAYANPKMFGGYYSGKRDENDLKAGDIIITGHHLPHWMAHNPYFEAMQMAATMRRATDTANGNGAPDGIMNTLTTHKRDDIVSQAIKNSDPHNPDSQLVEVQDGKQLYQVYIKGKNATSIVKEGGIKQGINTAAKGLLEQIPFTSIGDIMASTSSPSTEAGSVVKNLVEPRFVQEIAEWTDKKDGEMVKRDPQGFVEQLKSGIPGLRKYVTEKEVKQDKALSTIRIPAGEGEQETVLQLTPEMIAERQKINEAFLKDKEQLIRKYFKAYKLTEHDIQQRLKHVSNDYSAPIIYRKYKDKLKQVDE